MPQISYRQELPEKYLERVVYVTSVNTVEELRQKSFSQLTRFVTTKKYLQKESIAMTSPTKAVAGRHQRRMGPAPFASFEDLSDELESPEDKNIAGSVVRLPGIREDLTPTTSTPTTTSILRSPSPVFASTGISLIGANNIHSLQMVSVMTSLPPKVKSSIKTNNTPRIDISRASSSSHHDSRDSSPDKEILDFNDPTSAKLGLGFKEDGTLELRSSTEELDFHDIQERKNSKVRPISPDIQEEVFNVRKDSQCSDIILLSISGRTSRLSSIGSQGSGQSHLSNASHLSVMSGQSELSRSSSPYKMVLETSFCGTKPTDKIKKDVEQSENKVDSEVMEKILLSRRHDPTEVILAEGVSVDTKEKDDILIATPEKQIKKVESNIEENTYTGKDAPSDNEKEIKPNRFISESGVEYIFIPLKGPLPVDSKFISSTSTKQNEDAQLATKSVTKKRNNKRKSHSTNVPSFSHKQGESNCIRIKLKPDISFENEQETTLPDTAPFEGSSNIQNSLQSSPKNDIFLDLSSQSQRDPNYLLHTSNNCIKSCSPQELFENNIKSITPSPSTSRRNSFALLFKSKEGKSPESVSLSGYKRKNTLGNIISEASDSLKSKNRNRSKSGDRDSHKSSISTAPSSTESIEGKSKNKSIFSIFKSSKKCKLNTESENSSQETLPNTEGINNIEFKFNKSTSKTNTMYYENPLESASIRIPLHSPTYYEEKEFQFGKTYSEESQETVIKVNCKNLHLNIESKCEDALSKEKEDNENENTIASTNFGSNSELFTTNLQTQHLNEIEHDMTDLNCLSKLSDSDKQLHEKNFIDKKNNVDTIECSKSNIKNSHDSHELDSDKRILQCPKKKLISQLCSAESNSAISIITSNAENNSSESERESETFSKNENNDDIKPDLDISEVEWRAIVLQDDSFDDELPYVPTTLPLERSVAMPIVPVKQRSTFDIKMHQIERPRSSTPINPSCLEEYCEEVMCAIKIQNISGTAEKLKISLPRSECLDQKRIMKSFKKRELNSDWVQFSEKEVPLSDSLEYCQENEKPPPLPPKGLKAWVNFEDLPEKRKPPKRIQTIPSRSYIEVPESLSQESIVYNYVNPDECKCECHEVSGKEKTEENKGVCILVQEDELPLLDDYAPEEEKNEAENLGRLMEITVPERENTVR